LKIAKILTVACAALMATSGFAMTTLEKIEKEKKIVLGHYPDNLPFAYYVNPNAPDKKPVGFSVDLCLAIANAVKKQLNLPTLNVEYRIVNGKTRFSDLEENKIDVECGSSTNNPERRRRVAFTIPHFVGGLIILSKVDKPVRGLDELDGKTIAHIKGGGDAPQIERAKAMGSRVNVMEVTDTSDAFNAIADGKADAMIWDDSVLAGLRADSKNPSAYMLGTKNLEVEPLALMIRKGDPAFKKLVDNEMRRMMVSGEFSDIYSKWFEKPIPPKGINLNYPMTPLTRNTLRFPTASLGDEYLDIKGTMGE